MATETKKIDLSGYCGVLGIDVGDKAGAVAVQLRRFEETRKIAGVRVVDALAWPRWRDRDVLEFIRQTTEAAPGRVLVAIEKAFTERREAQRHKRDVGRAQGRRGGIVLGICLAWGIDAVEVRPVHGPEVDIAWSLLGKPVGAGSSDQEHVRDACGIVMRVLGPNLPAGTRLAGGVME